MQIIKPSSTRSPGPWALRTEFSQLDGIVRTLASSLALLAIWQSATLLWPTSPAGAGTAIVTGLTAIAWLWQQRPVRTVLSHDGTGRWSMHWQACGCHGLLCPGGYYSQWLIVLAIRSEGTAARRGAVHRCIVWRDAVTPRDFSYLQLMMMTTTLPESRAGRSA